MIVSYKMTKLIVIIIDHKNKKLNHINIANNLCKMMNKNKILKAIYKRINKRKFLIKMNRMTKNIILIKKILVKNREANLNRVILKTNKVKNNKKS